MEIAPKLGELVAGANYNLAPTKKTNAVYPGHVHKHKRVTHFDRFCNYSGWALNNFGAQTLEKSEIG